MINNLFYRFEALWPKILPPDLKPFVYFFFTHPLDTDSILRVNMMYGEYIFTTAIYYNQLLRITLWPNMTYFWIKVLLLRPTFQLSYYCYGHTIMTFSAKYIFSN